MLKRIERVFIDKTNLMKVEVQYIGRTVWRENIENFFHKEGIKIKNIEFVYDSETEGICLYTVLVPRNMDKGYIISEINGYTEVAKVHMT